ncbi:TetR/AcrR family transcriptional regulator [Tatumella ptyseos]|uniref:TetR/AcrR family transcriptional regulator n=1 Tax=Tatumella ptyseos TaxID=82987 RepID=UPI0026ECCBE9|nr:TetR/AcrR family transcriptional regulator [Tatumella ptyseos]WKX26123.1 TetR/AcrR family transcriptional regulator [Tatumella ptyseos]
MKLNDIPASPVCGRPKSICDKQRRQDIIGHAYRAFIELGFAQISTAEIARRAKISKRTLYETFSDKKTLFAATISENCHLLVDLPRPSDEPCALKESLFRIFRLDISHDEILEREAILRLMTREAILFPEISDYLYEAKAVRSRELLMEWLQETAEVNGLLLEDAEILAGLLMDVVFGALLPHRRELEVKDRNKVTNHIKKRIEIILLGMGWL